MRDFRVLGYDVEAEARFQSLIAQKIRIGTQDLKIPAIALSQRATLVTRNRQDFERVAGLALEDWFV